MDIKEKAKEYAEGKAINALSSVIEQAYMAGFKDGLEEGQALNKEKNCKNQDMTVEYKDLDLPSGTQWSSNYLKNKEGEIIYMTYKEASKLSIPTKEQFYELTKFCKLENYPRSGGYYKGAIYVGKNGEDITIPFNSVHQSYGVFECSEFAFWLKQDNIPEDGMIECAYNSEEDRFQFSGYKLPVMLVK